MLDISPATNGKSAVCNSKRLDSANVSAALHTSSKASCGRSILSLDKFSKNRMQEMTYMIAMLTKIISGGNMSFASIKEAGYTGPNTRPMMLVEKAFWMFELTNQISNCITSPTTG